MPAYTPPRVIATKTPGASSVVLRVGGMIPCLIGLSNGKRTLVQAYAATMGASNSYVFSGLGIDGPVDRIVQLRSKQSGGLVYVSGTDFTFDDSTQTITWLNVALRAPYIKTVAEVSGTSDLVADTTYYWVITAVKTLNETGPVSGETVASNEISNEMSASGKIARLTWQPVVGAESYRIYRSTISGNFTGNALVASVTGEYTTTYDDDGSATQAGSPPGVSVYALVTTDTEGPYNLEPSDTLTISVDGGGAQTVTFTGTRASRLGSGAVYNVTITLGVNDALNVKIDDGATQALTIPAATYTAAALAAALNILLSGGYFDVSGGQIRINSDSRGSGSSVQIVSGSSIATIGLASGTTTGTGNVVDIDAVTATEVVAAINDLPLVGAAAVLSVGLPTILHDTAGVAYTLQVTGGTANDVIDFGTDEEAGATATAGTAYRRPAWNAGSTNFYVDYEVIQTENLVLTQFTQVADVEAEYGLGSDLTNAAILAMGTSGNGNGAPAIACMSVEADTIGAYQAALTELEKSRIPYLIVPLTTVDGINDALLQHCVTMSGTSHRRRRMGIVGDAIGTMPGDVDTADTAVYIATAINNKRIINTYPWPFILKQQTDGSLVETEVSGFYMAAAVAGAYAALPDRATPLTQKRLFGITKLGITMDEPTMDTLGEASILVVFDDFGAIKVRQSLSSSADDAEEQQPAVLMVEDQLCQQLEVDFKQFLGQKMLRNTVRTIQDRTADTLRIFVSKELILSFNENSISASQDATNRKRVNVTFRYTPIEEIGEIVFSYDFDLSTTL